MKIAKVIIGSGFGDEGKGLLTDYCASATEGKAVVIRFNGGAQAGHTVTDPGGRRHVFSHFGAGTLAECSTYLSSFFIASPMLFVRELDLLRQLNVQPRISISEDCFLTTPIDVFLNQMKELQRGNSRHGSCGVGINETVTRCLRSDALRTQARDMLSPDLLLRKLHWLAETWLPERMLEMNINSQDTSAQRFLSRLDAINTAYLNDVQRLRSTARITADFPQNETVIFEGAQGLLLDEDRIDQYPHVTRSKTGLTNVIRLVEKLNIDQIEVIYVSRTYRTRHGAGPLAQQSDWTLTDQTNTTNQFQGSLRFAPLDCTELDKTITLDLSSGLRQLRVINQNRSKPITLAATMAFTCLDQIALPAAVSELTLPVSHLSYGPNRTAVQCVADSATPTFLSKGHTHLLPAQTSRLQRLEHCACSAALAKSNA